MEENDKTYMWLAIITFVAMAGLIAFSLIELAEVRPDVPWSATNPFSGEARNILGGWAQAAGDSGLLFLMAQAFSSASNFLSGSANPFESLAHSHRAPS